MILAKISTDLFAAAEHLSPDECRALLLAIYRCSGDGLSEKALIAYSAIGAQIERERERLAELSQKRSAAAVASHANRKAAVTIAEFIADYPDAEQHDVTPKAKRTDYESEPLFVEFWTIYPRTRNVSKKDAFRFFLALKEDERTKLVDAAKCFASEMKGKDERYIPHPSTYINGRRWETAAASTPTPTKKPKFFS